MTTAERIAELLEEFENNFGYVVPKSWVLGILRELELLLQDHDRQVAAAALREAADQIDSACHNDGLITARGAVIRLRDRAELLLLAGADRRAEGK